MSGAGAAIAGRDNEFEVANGGSDGAAVPPMSSTLAAGNKRGRGRARSTCDMCRAKRVKCTHMDAASATVPAARSATTPAMAGLAATGSSSTASALLSAAESLMLDAAAQGGAPAVEGIAPMSLEADAQAQGGARSLDGSTSLALDADELVCCRRGWKRSTTRVHSRVPAFIWSQSSLPVPRADISISMPCAGAGQWVVIGTRTARRARGWRLGSHPKEKPYQGKTGPPRSALYRY